MSTTIGTIFLRDAAHGGAAGQPTAVAAALADFIASAQISLELAIYDFRLSDALAATVVGAFTDAAKRGVRVRIGYDAGKPEAGTAADFALLAADPAPPGTASWVQEHFGGTSVQIQPIKAAPQLMHSKYLIRDSAAVWTGSTNFTDDAWTLQENNILQVESVPVAAGYLADFEDLWSTGAIKNTGKNESGSTDAVGGTVGWNFAPGGGAQLDAELCTLIQGARSRIVIASMVITSHSVLAALSAAIDRGVPVSGIYDAGQMDPIARDWAKVPHDQAVVADWRKLTQHLVPKHSTPYSPTGPHDFMHNKILVTDQVCATGSYNFSANAEKNAENQLQIAVPELVQSYADYIAAIAEAYRI
ncbi:phospholipase D-like domain-containing protein [Fodinicola feengrottensis]|uniref:phospholipase D n=1 Tax=Fodinicola feengrottensis TaxID=435914 RepID=A0ABP4U2S3_9ACTN